MGNLVERARDYATSAHARINQLRKYSHQPYDVHLRAVASRVATVTDDQAMIAAAWLHDTVEDTPATFDDLEREFGADVTALVKELTDVSKPGDGNRAARKKLDLEHLAGASGRAKTIKLADLIDNCRDICRHDAQFGRVFLTEMEALLEILVEGDRKLHAKAVNVLTDCARQLNHPLQAQQHRWEPLDPDKPIGLIAAGRHGIRLFTEAFAARDIQEPLRSYDAESLPRLCPLAVSQPAPAVIGIRHNGVITSYLSGDLTSGLAPEQVRTIDRQQIVHLETSLADVIHVLTHFTYCFVQLDGAVVGVISRGDIEKPVVRMWLFGIITLIEMQVVEFIRTNWPDDAWTGRMSSGRLEKARQLQQERSRRGRDASLLDCLQFSDKLQLILDVQGFIEATGFPSASAAKKTLGELESLRNNLAHGQDITSYDWPQIVRLARRTQQLYGS